MTLHARILAYVETVPPEVIRIAIPIESPPDHRGKPRIIPGQQARGIMSPKEYDQWRTVAATLIRLSAAYKAARKPIDTPARARILMLFARPESRRCKHVRACECDYKGLDNAAILAPVKPDWDNIGKGPSDVLNSPTSRGSAATMRKAERMAVRLFEDDAQIVDCRVVKAWAPVGWPECMVLDVLPIQPVTVLDLDEWFRWP